MAAFKQQLYASIKQYAKKMHKRAGKVSDGFTEPSVHQFRSALKTFRSLLRWQQLNKNIIPKNIKKSYRAAGKIRDAQLLLKRLVEEKTALPHVSLWLATRIGNNQEQWRKFVDKSEWQQLNKRIQRLKPRLQHFGWQSFYEKGLETMKVVRNKKVIRDVLLHEIRKATKDIEQILKWYKETQPQYHQPEQLALALKSINKQAGDYMDQCNGLVQLHQYVDANKKNKDRKAVNDVIKAWSTEKRAMKQRLLSSIHKFIETSQQQ